MNIPDPGEPAVRRQPLKRASELLARTDSSEPMVRAARFARRMAPGDTVPGDTVPGGATTLDRLADAINDMAAERPSAVRELGLASVSLWQSLWRGKAPDPTEPRPATILFTDLVDFSRWALRAGDDKVLTLLSEVNRTCAQVIRSHGGHVVKTLGDGTMAVFADPREGIEAAFEAAGAVSAIHLDSYRPALRAGLHTGAPRAVGDDFLGVDVNIAARVCAAAGAGEVYVSQTTLDVVGTEDYVVRRKRFRAKGVPKDLRAYRVVPRYDGETLPPVV
ncbi:MAG: adenylate/guanylate cyclase domain-containing protein [Gordonia sp. (in: high G+C Gram-positive bacteria)]|uniref:adenylate/guanylate cyclase domain-containing protein n=1 Tax=Gordonia sp. (in: high G+C Gram-positive bacteria) TaxID=84139 RepID=UPI0039E71067